VGGGLVEGDSWVQVGVGVSAAACGIDTAKTPSTPERDAQTAISAARATLRPLRLTDSRALPRSEKRSGCPRRFGSAVEIFDSTVEISAFSVGNSTPTPARSHRGAPASRRKRPLPTSDVQRASLRAGRSKGSDAVSRARCDGTHRTPRLRRCETAPDSAGSDFTIPQCRGNIGTGIGNGDSGLTRSDVGRAGLVIPLRSLVRHRPKELPDRHLV
jgi:hypothetical protein